jgi:glc operon protein GlcG
MADTAASLKLTSQGALRLLHAALAKAEAMGVPQCIAVVDAGGHLIAFARMDGAFYSSFDTALRKAQTAAGNGRETGGMAEGLDLRLAIASDGKRVNLLGGVPVLVDGLIAGAVGVGSGTGEQDREVARAGVAAIPGAHRFG